jgi:hypothetical protein
MGQGQRVTGARASEDIDIGHNRAKLFVIHGFKLGVSRRHRRQGKGILDSVLGML